MATKSNFLVPLLLISLALLFAHPFTAQAPNVGINTNTPQATLDVSGKIRVGDDNNPDTAGTIKFVDGVFLGYNGNSWLPITPYKKEILGPSLTASDGAFSYSSKTGVEAANEMCKDAFPGEPTARFYFAHDIDEALAHGLITGINHASQYWTVLHHFAGFSSTNSISNNCYNLLTADGAVGNGTRATFFVNYIPPGFGGLTGNYVVDYCKNVSCGISYKVVCGK